MHYGCNFELDSITHDVRKTAVGQELSFHHFEASCEAFADDDSSHAGGAFPGFISRAWAELVAQPVHAQPGSDTDVAYEGGVRRRWSIAACKRTS